MTFTTYEESRQKGTPVELYLFEWGTQPDSYFAYTNHVESITLDDGKEYLPIAIKRDTGLQTSGTLDKAQMKLRMQYDVSIRSLFTIWPPSSVVNATIRQGHFDDPDSDYKVVFAGKVMSFEREDSESIMTLNPLTMDMRTPNLRRYYQYACPYLLYGPQCLADREARTLSLVTTAVNTSTHTISFNSGWNSPYATGKFRRGEVRWTDSYGETQVRSIMAVGVVDLILGGPVIDLIVGQTVEVSLGCNHLTDAVSSNGDCISLHENGPNFGGQPWIPKKNPTGIRNGFY
jgi:hypothetical protein